MALPDEAGFAVGRLLIGARHPGIVRVADAHVGDHARNHLVVPRLDAGERNHDSVALHAATKRSVPREQKMRHAVGPAVVTVMPELERLAPRDIREVVCPVLRISHALFVENIGMKRVVGPGRIIFSPIICHGRDDDDDMPTSSELVDVRSREYGTGHQCDALLGDFCREELRWKKLG